MKKMVLISAITACAVVGHAAQATVDAGMKAELEALKAQVAELKKNQEAMNVKGLSDQVKELKVRTGGDNIKWSVDYRASYDMIGYKTVSGATTQNGVLMNRLWLGAKAAPRNDLSFVAQVAYNKVFGDSANHSQANVNPGYANFDWVTNENASDNTLKLKNAYVIYFGNAGDVPYTASVGRRSSTNGLLANLRDDDGIASPNAHMINVEFDGASFKFDLDKVTGLPGSSFKLCMGRGLTNAKPRFDMAGQDYMNDKTKQGGTGIDMFGFIAVPYDDGQYSAHIQTFKAWNLIGFTAAEMGSWSAASQAVNGGTASVNQLASYFSGIPFHNLGNMYGLTTSFIATGIGSGISDFLDNTTAFVSYSVSKTDPHAGQSMLGSTDDKVGNSFYAGVQMPGMITEKGKLGLEYNQGSKYWRSFTYGEDTMIGSKLGARGRAVEAYYTQPILGEVLSAQLRYTHIDYDYTGSNSFFGAEGTPYSMAQALSAYQGATGSDVVKSASDIRAYIRYRY